MRNNRQLDPSTLAILSEFYAERDKVDTQFSDLQARCANEDSDVPLSMEMFEEDWNASQFWYNERTATSLAEQMLHGATDQTRIAVISTPSAYVALRKMLQDDPRYEGKSKPQISLLEYDQRFSILRDDFVPYDFNEPIRLPASLRARFDCIIADPPFLSDECQSKFAVTVKWLHDSKKPLRLMVCTGERMEALNHELYAELGIRTTTFLPEHAHDLRNEWRCYANFECEAWSWQKPQAKVTQLIAARD